MVLEGGGGFNERGMSVGVFCVAGIPNSTFTTTRCLSLELYESHRKSDHGPWVRVGVGVGSLGFGVESTG